MSTLGDPGGPPRPDTDPVSRFIGWLMLGCGGLMALLCGGCTLVVWAIGFSGGLGQGVEAILSWFLMALVLGGVPTAIAALIGWLGWRIVRRPRPPRPVDETFT